MEDASGTRLRVALVGCSGMLGEIIGKAVTGEPDLAVVADVEAPAGDLPDLDADIVLWNNADESAVRRWLWRNQHRCHALLIATLGDGQDAALWELVPQRTRLGELSQQSLVDTIRSRAGGGR